MKNRIYAPTWESYELIDAGDGLKLERWGPVVTIRPEINAYFKPELSKKEWVNQAHAQFIEERGTFGNWKMLKPISNEWVIDFHGIKLIVAIRNTKHTGIFPEQSVNWQNINQSLNPGDHFLNLFGYSGASSVMGTIKGAQVVHVDSSKSALTWAKENQEINGANGCKLVLEDALLFMDREIKRKHQYHLIQMDPPAWGIGTKGKKWQLENHIDSLINQASKLLLENGKLIVSTYSPRTTPAILREIGVFSFPSRNVKVGILASKSTTGKVLEHGSLLIVE